MEDLNPSFSLLDIFIQFLLNGSSDFTWDPQQKRHAMHNYEHRLDEIIQDYKYKHIDLTSATMYREQNQC